MKDKLKDVECAVRLAEIELGDMGYLVEEEND